jgi:hypothetical protein
MTISPGVFVEWYDDDVTLAEVSDTEFFEIYDGSITVRSYSTSIPFTMAGTLFVKSGNGFYPVHQGVWKVAGISATVSIAPLGTSVIIDIKRNGVSIFSDPADRPTIASGEEFAVVGEWDDLSYIGGTDRISVDVVQVGSLGSEGDTLIASVLLERTA